MNRYLEDVKKFHETFNQLVCGEYSQSTNEIRKLRIKLLFEELAELATATGCMGTLKECCDTVDGVDTNERDLVEELDALVDLQYVLSGAILSMGHQDNFDDAFDEVQRSNMSKVCENLEQALETKKSYSEKGIDVYITNVKNDPDKYVVIRSNDGKVLKNIHYSAADLKRFIKD